MAKCLFLQSFHHTIPCLLTGCPILSGVIRFRLSANLVPHFSYFRNMKETSQMFSTVERGARGLSGRRWAWSILLSLPCSLRWGTPPAAPSTGDPTAHSRLTPGPNAHPTWLTPSASPQGQSCFCFNSSEFWLRRPNKKGVGRVRGEPPPRGRGCSELGPSQALSMRSCAIRFLSKEETRKLVCS